MMRNSVKLDFGDMLKGRSVTVSLRGGLCEEVAPLLGSLGVLDALDMVLSAAPDDYVAVQPDEATVIFGRKDDRHTSPDW